MPVDYNSETCGGIHKTRTYLDMPKSPSQFALKPTSKHTTPGILKEQLCHVWRFLMWLIGAQTINFCSMPTDNPVEMCDHDCAIVTCPFIPESSSNMP